MKKQSQVYFTPYQLKMPLEISKIIEISDPVYTFCEVMDHIDLLLGSTETNASIKSLSFKCLLSITVILLNCLLPQRFLAFTCVPCDVISDFPQLFTHNKLYLCYRFIYLSVKKSSCSDTEAEHSFKTNCR